MSMQCNAIRTKFLPSRGEFNRNVKVVMYFSRSCLAPQVRQFCNNKEGDKRLKDMVSESKENKTKDHYPVLGSGKHIKNSLLGDLIRELKGEPMQNSVAPTIPQKKERHQKWSTKYTVKNDPAGRITALSKHFDLINMKQRKENSSMHKEKMLNIVPDDSQVGELLRSLIASKGKFTDNDVKNIMSNIKPRPAEREKKIVETQGKNEFFSPQREEKFANRNKLFKGPQSHYFDSSSNWEEFGTDSKFVSIHEMKLKEIINSSIPKLGPTNAFEVLMNEIDKSWKFPIDNEIGLDEEDQSTFEDHVFLNEYLELFPMKGQIRRFMELVIIGLQQNPYCSVKEKVDKIYWFKDYFEKFSDEELDF